MIERRSSTTQPDTFRGRRPSHPPRKLDRWRDPLYDLDDLPAVVAELHARPDLACRGQAPRFDAEVLPGETDADRRARLTAAAQVCLGCPALAACREAARWLPDKQRRGLWGGHLFGGGGRGDLPALRQPTWEAS